MEFRINTNYGAWGAAKSGAHFPTFRNITVKDVTCDGARQAVSIQGTSHKPIENLVFENVTISSTRGLTVSESRNIRFSNVKITPRQGPVMRLNNCGNVDILRAEAPQNTDIYLQVEGDRSSDIRLEQCNLQQAEKPVVLKSGAQHDRRKRHRPKYR